MLKRLMQSGELRDLPPRMKQLRDGFAALTAVYLILASLLYPEPLMHRSFSFGLFFTILFISYRSPLSDSKKSVPKYDLFLAAISLVTGLYIVFNVERLTTRFEFFDPVTGLDMFFGVLVILLLIEGTWRLTGPWLPLLSMMALAYILFGDFIPGRFSHPGFSPAYIVDGLYLSTYGIWGSTMGTATGHIMLFLIFSSFFLRSGAGDFLFDFAATLTGSARGGIAKVAVVSSALFGMISGGPLSNVSTTGVLTIPAMKRKGYPADFAASTESCASVGGTFMPPIMGSVVFILAEIIGMPYSEIAKRALLPAIVYFTTIFVIIDARSHKLNIEGFSKEERKPLLSLIRQGAGFFLPLTYLIARLFSGITPSRVGLETTILILVLGLFLRKSLLHYAIIVETLRKAVMRGMMIVSIMASCGILIGVVNITGITAKFSSYLLAMADISIYFTLLIVMLITLFLGLAMNMTPSYLITAIICAPVLIQYGFEPLSVHMFILYYATTASITPPVAMTAFMAASIAETSPMRVGFMSMRMGLAAYVLPFVFVLNPAILGAGTSLEIFLAFVSALFGVCLIAWGVEHYWRGRNLNPLLSLLFLAGGALAMIGHPLLTVSIFVIYITFFTIDLVKFKNSVLRKPIKQRRLP